MIVCFDTSTLLSAAGWRGNPYRCLELVRAGHVGAVTCTELVEEFAEKLETKLGPSSAQIANLLADLLVHLSVVRISGKLKAVEQDPDDDKVLECAVVGRATHVITGDRRHLLPLRSYQGISIVTAAEFLHTRGLAKEGT